MVLGWRFPFLCQPFQCLSLTSQYDRTSPDHPQYNSPHWIKLPHYMNKDLELLFLCLRHEFNLPFTTISFKRFLLMWVSDMQIWFLVIVSSVGFVGLSESLALSKVIDKFSGLSNGIIVFVIRKTDYLTGIRRPASDKSTRRSLVDAVTTDFESRSEKKTEFRFRFKMPRFTHHWCGSWSGPYMVYSTGWPNTFCWISLHIFW